MILHCGCAGADEEKVFGVPSVRVDIGKRVAHQATHQMKDGMTVDFSKAFNDNTVRMRGTSTVDTGFSSGIRRTPASVGERFN